MLYDIGDKLKCKKEINTQCLEMCNPCFDIKIGDEYTVTDKSDRPADSPCYWYELTSGNGDIVLNAWNDEGYMIIDEIFEKIIE